MPGFLKTCGFAAFSAALSLLCASLHAGYSKGELLFSEDFKSKDSLSAWKNCPDGAFDPAGGREGKGAVHLRGGQLCYVDLEPGKFSGPVIFEAVYKCSGAEKPETPYWGAKAMFVIGCPGASTVYAEAPSMSKWGSFDWRTSSFVQNVPRNASQLQIVLGLQNVKGDYWCDHVEICRAVKTQGSAVVSEPSVDLKKCPGGEYRGFMSGRDLSEEAFQTLESWNANLLRYQINAGGRDISTSEKYFAWLDEETANVDKALALCKKHGLKMVLDLHSGPPGSRRNEASGNIVFDPERIMPDLKKAWTILATRYKGDPAVYGYDLLNEPKINEDMEHGDRPWAKMSLELAKLVREIDPVAPIIVEPDLADVRELYYIDVPNVIYSVHAYAPIEYTHQGFGSHPLEWSYPGVVDGVEWNRETLRKDLERVREFQLKHNAKIYVGEFSVIAWAPGRERYLRDLISVFEEYGWDWSYHAFREWGAWSLEQASEKPGSLSPSAGNPAKAAVLEALSKNKRAKPSSAEAGL